MKFLYNRPGLGINPGAGCESSGGLPKWKKEKKKRAKIARRVNRKKKKK